MRHLQKYGRMYQKVQQPVYQGVFGNNQNDGHSFLSVGSSPFPLHIVFCTSDILLNKLFSGVTIGSYMSTKFITFCASKLGTSFISAQVLQWRLLHCLDPTCCGDGDLIEALTRRSLRLFGHRLATRGGLDTAYFILSET